MAAALLAGCGSGSSAETEPAEPLPVERELDITLDGYGGPATAGILIADERGFFSELGIDLWVRTPQSRLRPLPYVAEEEVALAVSHLPQVVMARDKGAPIRAFGSLVSQPTLALIWPEKATIDGVAGLEGRTIAFTGLPFEREFLEAALEGEGMTLDDVNLIRADYNLLPALLNGRADAILGSSTIEAAQLEAAGMKPVVTDAESLGIPGYDELVLIVRDDRLEEDPQALRFFMQAVERGTAVAIANPDAAARAIAGSIGPPDAEEKALTAEVEATLPTLSEDGYMDPDQAEGMIGWMQEEGMIGEAPPVSDVLTNDYLPDQDE